jgi:hypothetical protein
MTKDGSPKRPVSSGSGDSSAKRIVAEVPEVIHRQVRLRCFQRGILVRDYILELLARDGIV